MQKYIALLRGINVGSKNKISMPELKAAFDEIGFIDVKTYINSGNIIFCTDMDNESEIKRICEYAIADKFKLDIPVAIISARDLSEALHNAPDWWGTDSESSHNAIFVIQPATAETMIEQVGTMNPEYEQVSFCGQVIFWSAKRKTYSRTRWHKITGTPMYASITIRCANTAKKLLRFLDGR